MRCLDVVYIQEVMVTPTLASAEVISFVSVVYKK